MRVPSSLFPAPQCSWGWQGTGEPWRVGSCPSWWMGVPATALQPGPLHTLGAEQELWLWDCHCPLNHQCPWEFQSLHWQRELGTPGGCRPQCRDPGNLHSLSQPHVPAVSKGELAARPARPAPCRSRPRAERSHAGPHTPGWAGSVTAGTRPQQGCPLSQCHTSPGAR